MPRLMVRNCSMPSNICPARRHPHSCINCSKISKGLGRPPARSPSILGTVPVLALVNINKHSYQRKLHHTQTIHFQSTSNVDRVPIPSSLHTRTTHNKRPIYTILRRTGRTSLYQASPVRMRRIRRCMAGGRVLLLHMARIWTFLHKIVRSRMDPERDPTQCKWTRLLWVGHLLGNLRNPQVSIRPSQHFRTILTIELKASFVPVP